MLGSMRAHLLLLTCAFWSAPALALEGFPASVQLPPDVEANTPTVFHRAYDEAAVIVDGKEVRQRGRLTSGYLRFIPEGNRPAADTWKKWGPLLKKAGWSEQSQEGPVHALKRVEGKSESWLFVELGDYNDPRVTLVEAGAQPRALTLKPPAAKPERVKDTEDWPFLGHFPGAVLDSTGVAEVPFMVPGDHDELQLLSPVHHNKYYTPPPTLSRLEMVLVYREALKAAGWDVLPIEDRILAHYAKNGRNLWVEIGRAADDSSTGLTYSVEDVGAEDWGKPLFSDCRLTLRGITFDFNKATLKADSTPVLEKAAGLLKSRPKLGFEVQGHTDNVGGEESNLKLSKARAESVRSWLVAHGVGAQQLISQGYGESRPVADNDSDAGRASNRRVELVCAKQ